MEELAKKVAKKEMKFGDALTQLRRSGHFSIRESMELVRQLKEAVEAAKAKI